MMRERAELLDGTLDIETQSAARECWSWRRCRS